MRQTVGQIKALASAVRRDILDMTKEAGVNGGHIGGALSSADILSVLYGGVLNISPETSLDPSRDRFFLSKGHISLGHYAVLAECGFLQKDELLQFEKSGSKLSTHSVMDMSKGIEISSGSLGYGLSIGVGSALAAKINHSDYKVFVLLGDGECNEGTVWEAAMAAARFELDNLTAIVDVNEQQLDGFTAEIMPVVDIVKAFQGFGFHVIEADGNDVEQLLDALNSPSNSRPKAIIAHTLKSKGVKSIEGMSGWHHVSLTNEQYERFVEELEAPI